MRLLSEDREKMVNEFLKEMANFSDGLSRKDVQVAILKTNLLILTLIAEMLKKD